jgi:hypothetical protein
MYAYKTNSQDYRRGNSIGFMIIVKKTIKPINNVFDIICGGNQI